MPNASVFADHTVQALMAFAALMVIGIFATRAVLRRRAKRDRQRFPAGPEITASRAAAITSRVRAGGGTSSSYREPASPSRHRSGSDAPSPRGRAGTSPPTSGADSRKTADDRKEPERRRSPLHPLRSAVGVALDHSFRFFLSKDDRVAFEPRLVKATSIDCRWYHVVYHGSQDWSGGRLAIRAAAVRGVGHAFDGKPGQDAAGVTWNESRGSLFIAVGDGLGNMPDSGDVAREAVESILDRCGQLTKKGIPDDEFANVAAHIRHAQARHDWSGATTLVVAEIQPRRDRALVSVWGVGDSEAWALDGVSWSALHHERRSDAENVTRQFPAHPLRQTPERSLPPGSVVVLASDGFASALASDGSPLSDKLASLWREPPKPVDFLAHVDYIDPAFNDDRAAVAVWIR